MRLEEIEQRAQRHIDNLIAVYGRLPPTQGSGDMLAYDLARAVLAMLPVVRAADALIADYRSETPDGGATTHALCKAVDTMRTAIGEGL